RPLATSALAPSVARERSRSAFALAAAAGIVVVAAAQRFKRRRRLAYPFGAGFDHVAGIGDGLAHLLGGLRDLLCRRRSTILQGGAIGEIDHGSYPLAVMTMAGLCTRFPACGPVFSRYWPGNSM